MNVNLLHILLVAPLLIYIGHNGKKTSELCFKAVLLLGIVVLVYHGYQYLNRGQSVEIVLPAQEVSAGDPTPEEAQEVALDDGEMPVEIEEGFYDYSPMAGGCGNGMCTI